MCHHESLKSCDECHTLKGDPKHKNVNLAKAFHEIDSDHSCVGCHNLNKEINNCAACHEKMPKEPSEASCSVCHAGEGVVADNEMEEGVVPAEIAKFDVPEKITIDTIKDKLQPVEFPHRAVIDKINGVINQNDIAKTFHGDDMTMCAGCHHKSPAGEKPPACSTCHGTETDRSDVNKPTIMGAYHRNCIECHKRMDVKDYISCGSCHKDKTGVPGSPR